MKLLGTITVDEDIINKGYLDDEIADLDSSQTATTGYALASVTEADGKLTGKTEIRIPVAYSGTTDPSSSLGENGDIYIKYSA